MNYVANHVGLHGSCACQLFTANEDDDQRSIGWNTQPTLVELYAMCWMAGPVPSLPIVDARQLTSVLNGLTLVLWFLAQDAVTRILHRTPRVAVAYRVRGARASRSTSTLRANACGHPDDVTHYFPFPGTPNLLLHLGMHSFCT